MTEPEPAAGKKGYWRQLLIVAAITIPYMIPLFWLWDKTAFPDSLGMHITAHGKGGLLENWWYSYLLLQRHQFWDVVTFIYMWAAVAGWAGWIAWIYWRQGREDSAAPRSQDF